MRRLSISARFAASRSFERRARAYAMSPPISTPSPRPPGAAATWWTSRKNTCTCPAHEESGARCKHLWAVAYHRHEVAIPVGENIMSEAVRPTYSQDWPALQRARSARRRRRVQVLLRGLCDGITEAPQRGRGRPRIPLKRRHLLRDHEGLRDDERSALDHGPAHLRGRRDTWIMRPPTTRSSVTSSGPICCRSCGRSSSESAKPLEGGRARLRGGRDRLRDADLRPMVRLRARRGSTRAALGQMPRDDRHADQRDHGRRRDRRARERLARCSKGLLERTAANGFEMREVSADKAYLSHANLAAVESVGADAVCALQEQ